jgi:hypothetical protein
LRVLPENTRLIPNLKSLRSYQSRITPEQIEPLAAQPNNPESVTVNNYYYNNFRKLAENYPNFSAGMKAKGSTMQASC